MCKTFNTTSTKTVIDTSTPSEISSELKLYNHQTDQKKTFLVD